MQTLSDIKADKLLFGVEVFGYDEETGNVELFHTRYFKSINAMASYYKDLSDRVTGVCILADEYGNKLGGVDYDKK